MAGRGAPPKPGDQSGHHGRSPEERRIRFAAAPQPALPAKMPDGSTWPRQTREWWKRWKASPLAEGLSAVEWDELLVAAVLHGRFWNGDVRAASELRLRVAKFGVTPEDRLRLRISLAPRVTLATPDEPEPKSGPSRSLRLVDV